MVAKSEIRVSAADEADRAEAADGIGDFQERTPLRRRPYNGVSSTDNHSRIHEKASWFTRLSNPLKVETIHPQFRHVPVLACLIMLVNEVGFYTK